MRTLIAKFKNKVFVEIQMKGDGKEAYTHCTSGGGSYQNWKSPQVGVVLYIYKNGTKTLFNAIENITVKLSVSHQFVAYANSGAYCGRGVIDGSASYDITVLVGSSSTWVDFKYGNSSTYREPRLYRMGAVSGLNVDKTLAPTGQPYVSPTKVITYFNGVSSNHTGEFFF